MMLTQQIVEKCAQYPENIAFSDASKKLSYSDFLQSSQNIRHQLVAHGIGNGQRVVIFLPRGIDAALSIYGCLFCGATYVPLDIQNPASRLRYILQDVQAHGIIGDGERPEWCPSDMVWLDVQTLLKPTAPPSNEAPCDVHAESIAAILYTSGSTGNPKGVAISHRAILAFSAWVGQNFRLSSADRIANLAPFHFDLSLFDLFSALLHGASTQFIPQKLTLSPKKLVDWLEENSITTWYTVPSILSFITLRGGLNQERLPAFKRLLFAGEVFPMVHLRKLLALLPHVECYNLFGPTETNVCTCWQVDASALKDITSPPIGRSTCNAELRISDTGELLVQGPCLMSGYWHAGGLQHIADTWYHTGDRVSHDEKYGLLYHGRMDRMIKFSGYRIEPAEIEHCMQQLQGVDAAFVFGENDAITGQRIIAMFTGSKLDTQSMRHHLKQHLATYMQPYRLIPCDTFPYLANGKLDIQSLQKTCLNNPTQ